jgi:hypothetical protein
MSDFIVLLMGEDVTVLISLVLFDQVRDRSRVDVGSLSVERNVELMILSWSFEDLVSNPSSSSEEFDLGFQVVMDQAIVNELEDLNLLGSQGDFRTFIVLLWLLLMGENGVRNLDGLIIEWVTN